MRLVNARSLTNDYMVPTFLNLIRWLGNNGERLGSLEWTLNPRFPPTILVALTLLKYLGGHPKSLKLFKIQHNVALKRLASAVQLRPWTPCFQ